MDKAKRYLLQAKYLSHFKGGKKEAAKLKVTNKKTKSTITSWEEFLSSFLLVSWDLSVLSHSQIR